METIQSINIDRVKEKFSLYVDFNLKRIAEKGLELTDSIEIKKPHSFAMCDAVASTTAKSGLFNESYVDSAAIDGLLHDVGRFKQFLLSGTLSDASSKPYIGFNDHGQYGAHLLENNNYALLRYFIGNIDEYYKVITEVVREHTNITNDNYKVDIQDLVDIFPNYDIEEVLRSNNEDLINKLIALKLLIVREEDSLEIFHKIRDGLWKPTISSEKDKFIHPDIWNLFLNQEYINMNELKEKGIWTCNAGFLLRYGLLLRNINFVGTLKTLLEDDIINKTYRMQTNNVTDDKGNLVIDETLKDPLLVQARDYINLAIRNLIETSQDGKIITSESRSYAKQKTLKEFK